MVNLLGVCYAWPSVRIPIKQSNEIHDTKQLTVKYLNTQAFFQKIVNGN